MKENWTCNIDRRGRLVRGIFGLVALGAGVWMILQTDHAFWGTGLCAFGAFGIFEALKGWCALRALGIQTPF